jgi:hypothetical protein
MLPGMRNTLFSAVEEKSKTGKEPLACPWI